MLKISQVTTEDSRHLIVEGRLAGPWVAELERVWRASVGGMNGSLVVDLTGVTFIESAGKDLLRSMWVEGAELLASGCCSRSIVEEITGTVRRITEGGGQPGTPR